MKTILLFLLIFNIGIAMATSSYTNIDLSSTVPTQVNGGKNASKQDLATFAWQEFVALNWPAAIDNSIVVGSSGYLRGQPSDSTLGSTGSGGTLVWHTYHHRVELYPYNPPSGKNALPDINFTPNYVYPSYINITKADSSTDLTLFNNLDEASEISLANMYYKPFVVNTQNLRVQHGFDASHEEMSDINEAAIKAAIVYEAKANNIIYNYVNSNGFQEKSVRDAAAVETLKKITNMPYDNTNTFELPNGSIEIKATWRRYDSNVDNLDNFIWQNGIFYTGSGTNLTANNAKMLLIGLHIIQKTPNFPTFTFATFEHNSLEKDGFIFNNTNPMTTTTPGVDRKLPDPGNIEAIRQFAIPGPGSSFDLQTFNTNVQNQIKSQFSKGGFLANYQLIGIQAEVTDNPTASVPPQEFYLSNFATETNDTLQFFQGGLAPPNQNVPDPNTQAVHTLNATTGKFSAHSAGGCKGCHGAQAQNIGYDFSVISARGNFLSPEAIEPYPGGAIVKQNPEGFPLQQSN